jgi:3-deoxy-D-manno-octulosonate 8-phosphate phosphatase (KDO 8-P phosphatase)
MNKNIQNIKLILMDVDGVLTDGRVILGKNEELKFFNIHDGMGIHIARESGLKTGIITGRTSEAVEKRGRELKIDYVIQGSKKKIKALDKILKAEKMDYNNVCFIGDDIIDIPIFRKVGFSATVKDAPENVKSEADYISSKDGGRGAVREIIEYILKSKGTLDSTINKMIKDWSG